MATATVTPPIAKQRAYHFLTPRKDCNKDLLAWCEEIDGRIVSINASMNDFLHYFVPGSSNPPPLQATQPFDIPLGKLEASMYEPLVGIDRPGMYQKLTLPFFCKCIGLTKLVSDFPHDKRLCFHNSAHRVIKFPFQRFEHEFHTTKPDIVASLPGQVFEGPFPDRWRNISTVFEVKSAVQGDPMEYGSLENDEALVQLAMSARNILVSQSRLFVFVVGVYGHFARIYRFDHAGAVCSARFNYQEDPSPLRRFLWRLAHPIHENCDIIGADPTVRLSTKADRKNIESALRASGIEHTAETWKTCRWTTVQKAGEQGNVRYLLYDPIFLNPGLFSRATTVWAGLEVDDNGHPSFEVESGGPPREKRVIVKDAWQQLARRPETEHYEQIYASIALQVLRCAEAADTRDDKAEREAVVKAWDEAWTGLAEFVAGEDLGAEELKQDVEARVGHQTSTAVYQHPTIHQLLERSHMRTVSKTIGQPISDFKCTQEMVQVLLDAIEGTRLGHLVGMCAYLRRRLHITRSPYRFRGWNRASRYQRRQCDDGQWPWLPS